MNPLDLTGPEFLRFYVPYGLCVSVLAWLVRLVLDRVPGPTPSARWTPGTYPREGDAYKIALLRGDRQEAVRTVLGRLLSDKLIDVGDQLVRKLPEAERAAARLQPIEVAALGTLKMGESLRAGKAEQRIQTAIEPHLREIESELEREGLLPQRTRKTAYNVLWAAAWLAVGGLGIAKIVVALSRGRLNLGFLVLLLIGFTVLIARLLVPKHRTRAAQKYLDWLQESHRGLVQMIESGRRNSVGEMALAAGIYGLASVPDLQPLRQAFQPPPQTHSSDSSSSGSSCSSSSCGGGCGGGGCGGCGG